ncbi:MAG: hypothetical protein ABFD97_10060 [Syntrophobacter sp.]
MASRNRLIQMFMSQGNMNKAGLDRIGIALAGADLIRSGGRGRYTVDMDCKDAKNLLIGVMASGGNVSSVVRDVVAYNALPVLGDRYIDSYGAAETFGEAIESILSMSESAFPNHNIKSISVCRTWPEGRISWTDSDGTERQAIFREQNVKRYLLWEDFTVHKSFLDLLWIRLNKPSKVGWAENTPDDGSFEFADESEE